MRSDLLLGATAPVVSAPVPSERTDRTFQASITGTGAVSATVVIEVSNDGTNYLTLATITLSGTTSASDGFASSARWALTRANLTAVSGTSAAVSAAMVE